MTPAFRKLTPAATVAIAIALASAQPWQAHAYAQATPAAKKRATQPTTAAKQPAAPAATAKLSTPLDAARAALAAGRVDEAIETANGILATTPTDEAAAGVKIDALLTRDQRKDALDVYDAYQKAAQRPSTTLLAPIAKNELRALTHAELSSMHAEALGALAAVGDKTARTQLEKLATDSPSSTGATMSANEALARLGDAHAAERLVSAVSQIDPSRRVMALTAIATVPHAPALPLVRDSLRSTDPTVQAAAADAAGMLGLKELEPDLRQIARTGHPYAQGSAILALSRFGDAASKERVHGFLSSPAPSMQIQAARALEAVGDRSWVPNIQPLLKDQEGLTRFLAAELLLPIDRQSALDVLDRAIADPNPAIRGEVARILTADANPNPTLLRTLLQDSAPRVRLLAARSILTLR